jgi:hypothetical protein
MADCLAVGFAGVEAGVIVYRASLWGASAHCISDIDDLPKSIADARLIWNTTSCSWRAAYVPRLRARGHLVVCAVDSPSLAAAALAAGATDVLTRPWTDETLARLDRFFDPSQGNGPAQFLQDPAIRLRATELRVFEYLISNRHRFVTANELQREVLGTHGDGSAIRYHVSQIRRRLGSRSAIETRPKFGYRIRDATPQSGVYSTGALDVVASLRTGRRT